MKKKFKLLLVSMMLTLCMLVTGCSASIGKEVKNQSIREVVENYSIVNDEDVINAFSDLGVTSTKSTSNKFKNGTGKFTITSKDGDKYSVVCEDFVAKQIQDDNGKVLKDFENNSTTEDNITTEEATTESMPTIIDDGTTESTTEAINDTPDTGYTGGNYTAGTEAKHSDIFKVETDDDYSNDITKDEVNNSSDYIYLYNTNMPNVYILERRYAIDAEQYSNGLYSSDFIDAVNKVYKTVDNSYTVNKDIVYDITEAFIGSYTRTEDEKLSLLAQASALVFEPESSFSYVNKMIFDNDSQTYYFFYTTFDNNDNGTYHYIIYKADGTVEKDGSDYTNTYNKLISSFEE